MNSFKSVIPYTLIIIFIGSCCNSDKCKEKELAKHPEFYRFTLEGAKEYLWAKPGSWWIYKNTRTGEYDTQTVTYFKFDSVTIKGTLSYTKHITIKYDRLFRNIYSTYNKWTYYDKTIDPTPNSSSFNGNYRIIIDREVYGEGKIYPFFYPIQLNYFFGNGSTTTEYRGSDPSLTIQGINYTDVIHFDIDKDDIWERKLNCIRSHNGYYYAKNIGLIKKRSYSCNFSWDLIDYNIIN